MRSNFKGEDYLKQMRAFLRFACVVSLSLATMMATPFPASVSPTAERTCCAQMAKNPGDCVPQSGGMTRSCCNMQACLQLFIQTGELNPEPGYAEFAWENFNLRESRRTDRPPVPPPRA